MCIRDSFPGASPVKYFTIVGQKGTRNLYALVRENQEGLVEKGEPKKKNKHVSEDDLLPEEKIDLTYLFYKNNIKRQILDHILDCHPSFFEQLVVNLLLEMGYGSDELSGRVLGKSHDGGIDGVIYEDKLGLSKIYICLLYTSTMCILGELCPFVSFTLMEYERHANNRKKISGNKKK